MKVSMRELKGKKAYLKGQKDPIGVFFDGVLDKDGFLTGYMIKTLSLVPLSKLINKDDIEKIEKDKVILKKETKVRSLEILKNTKTIKTDDISAVIMPDLKKLKAGDICFDFETGKMCDIVVSKGIFASKQKVGLNKICLKENTIYIQKEGGD